MTAHKDIYHRIAHPDQAALGGGLRSTKEVKRMIARMTEGSGRKNRKGSRHDAIHLLSAAVGALILSRAVDESELSDEVLASARDSLAAV